MKKLLVLVVVFCLFAGFAEAREANKGQIRLTDGGGGQKGDFSSSGSFGSAVAGTTWIGWVPGAYNPVTNPHSIGAPGIWDFDDRGTRPCPVQDGYQEYIKNGAYAQDWTSEDVLAQKELYWHAEDFSDPSFSCQGNTALSGVYSAWCGLVTPDPSVCFNDAPGYGHDWNQWLCRTIENPTALQYTFKSNTEPSFDYAYVLIDAEFPDSCGWVAEDADTLRCYDGINGPSTETFDLTNLPGADPDFCEDGDHTTSDYSDTTVKICFVVVSDGGWDDQDGAYATCDGAFTVDDIYITTTTSIDSTKFETGTLETWISCGGFSPGDSMAIRHRSSFLNNDVCGFDNCTMADCVITFYNPDIPGQYGTGGHYAGACHKRVWSPPVYLGAYPPRGHTIDLTRYVDLPIPNWFFDRWYVTYVGDPDCPAGAWSAPLSDNYVYYASPPSCNRRFWGFSYFIPTDAESVKIGYSIWSGCLTWEVPCTNGNDSPIVDNARLGIWDLSAPTAHIRAVDNYMDAFPEDDILGDPPSTKTALIDAANNTSQTGSFLRMADTAVVSLAAPDAKVEFCFRIRPGPGTDTLDPWFGKYGEDGLASCDTTEMHCTRMDTCFAAGNGIPGSPYEFQITYEDKFGTMIHEDDPLYAGEGEEILPDSLFTPGTKIFYSFRSCYLPGPGPYEWLPFGADPTGEDVETWYEVSVLPDQCKDPAPCLLYVDYYNRGAQEPIEDALAALGRMWDRFDLRAESSHQANGIGNRLLGAGRYRLTRGPTGPSNDHLAQYKVMLLNTGHFDKDTCISDGGNGTPDDPSNDIGFLDQWINEGGAKGLWMSGDNIANDFATAMSGPKPAFLSSTLCASLVASSYREYVGHPHDKSETCRELTTHHGYAARDNYWDAWDSVYLTGSACPDRYDYDVLDVGSGSGICGYSLQYDDTHVSHGPGGLAASIYHIFPAANAPNDTVRTLIDGFSMHYLRDGSDCGGRYSGLDYRVSIALWIRDVLGGDPPDHLGFMYDRLLEVQYCPPEGTDTVTGVDLPRRGYFNALFQNYPNPFRGVSGTTIQYSVAKEGWVEVHIFDAAGRLINTISKRSGPGENSVTWDGRTKDGRRVASGVYFYQIVAGDFRSQKKMLLVE